MKKYGIPTAGYEVFSDPAIQLMKTIPLDLIRVLVIQQIDKLYYRDVYKRQGEDRFLHSRVIYTGGEPGSRVIEGYTQDMTRIVERVRELEEKQESGTRLPDPPVILSVPA